MKVRVFTFPIRSNYPSAPNYLILERESKVIDWKNSSDRKWLANHQHWAFNNRHALTIRPIMESCGNSEPFGSPVPRIQFDERIAHCESGQLVIRENGQWITGRWCPKCNPPESN